MDWDKEKYLAKISGTSKQDNRACAHLVAKAWLTGLDAARGGGGEANLN